VNKTAASAAQLAKCILLHAYSRTTANLWELITHFSVFPQILTTNLFFNHFFHSPCSACVHHV